MSWWMWVLLWTALVLVSAACLALLALRLWRQFSRALHDLGDFGDCLIDRLDTATQNTESDQQSRRPDVFTPWSEARRQYRSGKLERRTARSQRRSARRRAMGQPQKVSDLTR